MPTPPAEVAIDVDLVAALLEIQHPDLAGAEIRPVAAGWDNALFRIGAAFTARLPRRSAAVPLVLKELRWLPVIAAALPLPVPVPLRAGAPGCGYPWPWSIGPWLPGDPADVSPPADLVAAADSLGTFLAALHQPAPPDAPINPFRGVPLPARDHLLESGLERLDAGFDPRRVRARWAAVRDTPPWSRPPVWLHGDVHPLNLLVHRGRLAGVLDFGDLAAGDPASDLAIAWMMFTGASRTRFRDAVGADADTWRRALGWALALGVTLANGDGRLRAIGIRTIGRALEEDAD
jgi:aminoglycoside phosphotransferase (APT) family kinase protein